MEIVGGAGQKVTTASMANWVPGVYLRHTKL